MTPKQKKKNLQIADFQRLGDFLCADTWNTCMRTLGKHVLQIQVEVFHTVAATAEHGEYGLIRTIGQTDKRTKKSLCDVQIKIVSYSFCNSAPPNSPSVCRCP